LKADANGVPRRVRLRNTWHEVVVLHGPWHVNQYWWRSEPVNRMYFRVAPGDGAPLTVYHDLNNDEWRRQEYR
jgi:hypothetical protein